MSEERSDPKSILAADGAVAKLPWHPPELQEVDLIDTESGGGNYQPADSSTYTSGD